MFVHYFMNYFEPITIHFSQYRQFRSSLILRETWRETSLSPLWRFVKIPTVWREQWNARWEKWLARWFMKCHLYTYCFSHFANIFSGSRRFDKNAKKMLVKREKQEMYRWHFVNQLVHFSNLAFRRSCQAIGIFTKCQRRQYGKFLVKSLTESKMNEISDIVKSV